MAEALSRGRTLVGLGKEGHVEDFTLPVERSLSCILRMEVTMIQFPFEKVTPATLTVNCKGKRRDSERPEKQLDWSGLACVKWVREI